MRLLSAMWHWIALRCPICLVKSATAITDYLTSDESFDPETLCFLLQRTLKKKAEQVLEPLKDSLLLMSKGSYQNCS